MKLKLLVPLVTLLVCAGVIEAATIEETLAHCRSKSQNERLACYDELARAVAGGVSLPPLPDTGIGKWDITQEVSPIDDSMNVTLLLVAEKNVRLSQLHTAHPALFVRCQENRTQVFIGFLSEDPYPLGYGDNGNGPVLTRFDREKAEWNSWSLSVNRKAVFAPSPQLFWAKKIELYRKLFVQIIPEDKNKLNIVFDLTGSKKAMAPLRKACGW